MLNLLLAHILFPNRIESQTIRSSDAFIQTENGNWRLGTTKMERVVKFSDGQLRVASLIDKATGRELLETSNADEKSTEGWHLVHSDQFRLRQGELELDIQMLRDGLQATKSFVVYPGSSIVREWSTYRNIGQKPIIIADPSFLTLSLANATELNWMTGADDRPGCWVLKKEKLVPRGTRKFDSYDPFPAPQSPSDFPGDGINAKILLNDKQIWPVAGWQYVANATVTVPVDVQADVKTGDRLVFLVNCNQNIGWDTTAFDPTIDYGAGDKHTASQEFSEKQGRSGWKYQYLEGGKFVNLVYYPASMQWRKQLDNSTGTPFVRQTKPTSRSGSRRCQSLDRPQNRPRAHHVRSLQHRQRVLWRFLRVPNGIGELRSLGCVIEPLNARRSVHWLG